MKSVIAALVILSICSFAQASQIGCEATIALETSNMLQEQKIAEVVTGDALQVKYLSSTALYTINSAAEYGKSKTKWAVFVKTGEQNTCQVISIVEDKKIIE